MRLLPIILWVTVAVVLLLPLLRRMLRSSSVRPTRALPDELVKDPVCQTYVVKSRAVRRTEAGEVRYFCSEACARLDTGR